MTEKPRILVINPTCLDVVEEHRTWVEAQGFELLAEPSYRNSSSERLSELLGQCDAVILPSSIPGFPTAEQMAASPRLKVCAAAASGFEWLDVEAATRLGIVVSFAPGGAGAEVVAEMAYALMFAVSRQIPFHHEQVCQGDQSRGMGRSLFGKTLGIVGLGNIGREVALRAGGLKLLVIAHDPHADRGFAKANRIRLVTLEELLRQSDYVSLHVRLCDETRHMIGAHELAFMKPTAYLINTARGGLVVEADLAEAVMSGRIAGAGLDDPPGSAGRKLCGLPNVVFTPHLGNRAIEGANSIFRSALESAMRAIRGEKPRFVANPLVYNRSQCQLRSKLSASTRQTQ